MTDESILRLLKSPVLEDTLIGLGHLSRNNTREEIINFFNRYGQLPSVASSNLYLSKKAIMRPPINDIDWVLCRYEDLGFYVRHQVLLTKFPETYKIVKNYYKIIEL